MPLVFRRFCSACALLLVCGCADSGGKASRYEHAEAGVVGADASTLDPNSIAAQAIYADVALGSVAEGALEFTPDYPLWSDGANKRRWLLLPEGAQIDTSDMDHWQFPVGTKFVKEFSLDGMRLETRVIERVAQTGNLKKDTVMSVFVWNESQTDAQLLKDGVVDLFGTPHDVPKQKDCIACHLGEPSGTLGFSAIQLSDSGMLETLVERDLLSHPPGRSFTLPGNEVERAAIGTLHANCGHCHTEGTPADIMRLRVLVSELDQPIEQWQLYRTTVGQALEKWSPRPERFVTRLVPGDPEASALLYRMERRESEESVGEQMPPLATELVDTRSVAQVRAWIAGLTPLAPADAGQAEDDAGATASLDAAGSTAAEASVPSTSEDASVPSGELDAAQADPDAGMDAEVDTGSTDAEVDAAPDAIVVPGAEDAALDAEDADAGTPMASDQGDASTDA